MRSLHNKHSVEHLVSAIVRQVLREGLSFASDEAKRNFIKVGHVLTFKNRLPGLSSFQVAIADIKQSKAGQIKIINPFGNETPWFNSMQELLDAIDWVWMEQNC